MFLTMLFGLLSITAVDVLAQNSCSKQPDGKDVALMVGNATGKAFTLNLVDQKCKEITSKKQIPKDDLFHFSSFKDAVYRVREVGTNRLLGEIIVDPAKPEMLVQTDLNNSNARIMYLEPSVNTASVPENINNDKVSTCSKKLSDKQISIKWLNKTNEYLQISMIDENCREIGGDYVGRNNTFETIAYPGYVYHLSKVNESDEGGGGLKDFKTITVTQSNGIMTLTGPNTVDEGAVSNVQENTGTANAEINEFKKHLIGTWKGKTGGIRYDQNTITSYDRYSREGVTKPYRIIDGKTVEIAITDDFRYSNRLTITLKDNHNTMVENSHAANNNSPFEYKRVK